MEDRPMIMPKWSIQGGLRKNSVTAVLSMIGLYNRIGAVAYSEASIQQPSLSINYIKLTYMVCLTECTVNTKPFKSLCKH